MSTDIVWKRCRLYRRNKDEDGYEPIVRMTQRFIPENFPLAHVSIAKFRCQRKYKRFTDDKFWTVFMYDNETYETVVNEDFATFEEARALADTLVLLNN